MASLSPIQSDKKNPDDSLLIAELWKGSEAGFRMLLAKYLPPLYAFLLQLTRDPNVAEDLAQETFIKVWKNFWRFDAKKNLKVWLFAIAKNTAYDFFKKKKALPFSAFEDSEGNNPLENVRDTELLPQELLERQDIVEMMGQALEKISESYRALLILRYKEDFTLSEVAEILGEPYNTIKSRHKRALGKLKAILDEDPKS